MSVVRNEVPQVGRTDDGPESHPAGKAGSPTDSGGGKQTIDPRALANLLEGLDKEKDKDKSLEKIGKMMTSTDIARERMTVKETYISRINKRKLRLDLEKAERIKAFSAPTSPAPTPSAPNIAVLDLTWDEEESRSVKRMKDDGTIPPSEEWIDVNEGRKKMANKLRNIIKNIDKEIKVVAEAAKERNTKKEIKETAQKLKSLTSQLMTQEAQAMLQSMGRDRAQIHGTPSTTTSDGENEDEMESLRKEIKILRQKNTTLENRVSQLQATQDGEKTTKELTKPTSKELGIQAEEHIIIQETKEYEKMSVAKIRNTIETGSCYEEFEEIMKEAWPEPTFKATKIEEGSPLSMSKEWDLAIIADPAEEKDRGLVKHLQNNAQEMAELIKECRTSDIEYIEYINRSSKTGAAEKRSYFFAIPLVKKGEGLADQRQIYDAVRNMKEKITDLQRTKIAVACSEEVDPIHVRKLLEIFSWQETIEWKVLKPRGKTPKKTLGTNEGIVNKAIGSKKSYMETIIVKTGDNSYSDAIRNMKQKINIEDLGITVSSLKKTAKEDIALRIKGGEGKANDLKREINEKMKSAKVDIIRRDTLFNIFNIEDTTTAEEIVMAVSREAKIDTNEVKLLRQSQNGYGSMTATIAIQQDMAKDLLKTKLIKIGWVTCTIKKKTNLLRCYRCLGFGHKREECKGTDRAKNCMNCGEEGHFANVCVNDPKCHSCNKIGHRMDTMKCPIFKKMINQLEARGRERP